MSPDPNYKPFRSSAEDFLHNYLGNIGIPIELTPNYPVGAKSVLLTQAAAADPGIVDKIKASLRGGATVVVTSGLVEALAGKGFADIAEWTPTGRTVAVERYVVGAGAGAGTLVDDGTPRTPILFPEIRFYTNHSWAVVRGAGGEKAYPVVLSNDYGGGTIVMITIPQNPSDLYRLPTEVLAQMRRFIGADLPARPVKADSRVVLFDYDNGAFVFESFRDVPTTVTVEVAAGRTLAELPSGATLLPLIPVPSARAPAASADTGTVPDHMGVGAAAPAAPARFAITLPAHSFRAYRIQS